MIHFKHKLFSVLCLSVAATSLFMQNFSPVSAKTSIHYMSDTGHSYIASPLKASSFSISSTPAVADISYGMVYGKYPGFTTVSYEKDGKICQQAICVRGILPSNPLLHVNEKHQMHVLNVYKDHISSWSSSNPYVAAISQKGLLLAKHEGSTTVSCTLKNGFSYHTKVDVISQYSKAEESTSSQSDSQEDSYILSCEESTYLMEPGDSYTPSVTVRKSTGGISSATLYWSSSDPTVASVDALGMIHAQSEGSALISCKAGDTSSIGFSVNVISDTESGKSCEFRLLTGSQGKERNYTLFKQNAHNYNTHDRYLAWHGCAHCSLTTVLTGYSSLYANARPDEIIDGLEKKYADSDVWTRNYEERSIEHQMPLSLNGISTLLSKADVSNEYVPSFKYNDAKSDILQHLKTGNPVIFEVRQKNQKTGSSSKRWTNSYHTMIFLGAFTNGNVLICDSVDRSWYDGGQRYKIVSIDDVMEYMFSSTKSASGLYYNGSSSDGGYIKIFEN